MSVILKDRIQYLVRTIKQIRNDEYVDDVLDIVRCPYSLKVHSYGKKNRGMRLYHIYINEIAGFFAYLRYTLEALYYADINGFVPVIEYGELFQQADVSGDENPYEVFFEQPSVVGLPELRESFFVADYRRSHGNLVRELKDISVNKNEQLDMSERYIEAMSCIYSKYIRLNGLVQKNLEDEYENLLGGFDKVLGVHFRGSDYRTGFSMHPKFVNEEMYVEEIDNALKKQKYDKIFLATDDENSLRYFIDKYGEIIVYYTDVMRSETEANPVILGLQDGQKTKLGYEVLRDTYTLAKCAGLIGTVTSIPQCAQIIKRSNGEKYTMVSIIDQGINKMSRKTNAKQKEKEIRKTKKS